MKRNPTIDSWRGVLILFVVFGHAVGMACHFSMDGVKYFLDDIIFKGIYIFHMPAFFSLAGVTWKRKEDEDIVVFAIRKAKRLIIPYIVFGMLSGLIYYLTAGAFFSNVVLNHDGYYVSKGVPDICDLLLSLVHAGGYPENGVFRGNSVLWFLPALFTVELLYWIIDKAWPMMKQQLLVIAILYVCGFFVPANLPWGGSRVLNLVAFLAIGRWGVKMLNRKFSCWIILFMLIGYVAFVCIAPNHSIVRTSLLWYVLFDLMASLGVFMSYKMAELVENIWVQRIGISALGIMLFHKYVIVLLQTKAPVINVLCKQGYTGAFLAVVASATLALMVACVLTIIVKKACPQIIGEKSRKC